MSATITRELPWRVSLGSVASSPAESTQAKITTMPSLHIKDKTRVPDTRVTRAGPHSSDQRRDSFHRIVPGRIKAIDQQTSVQLYLKPDQGIPGHSRVG